LNEKIDILTSAHSADGLDARRTVLGRKPPYRWLLRRGLILEKDGRVYITSAGRNWLDQQHELLPCAFKEFLLSRIPAATTGNWRSWIRIHLDDESNVQTIRELLPEPGLEIVMEIMDSSPEEIALVAHGQMRDGSWCSKTLVALFSPHFSPDAAISEWLAQTIIQHREELNKLLTSSEAA
jgi:hypothetical protein